MSICAGCNTVYPWAAFVTGFVAGLVYMIWSVVLEKIKVDDPLDAVAGITFSLKCLTTIMKIPPLFQNLVFN